jgi:class 3 adenylate cyclase
LRSVSIKYKLLSVLLGIGATAIIITGWLGYVAGKEGLTQTATNQLTGIRRSKAHQIEAYFGSIRSQVRMLSQSRMAIEALREFRSEFRNVDGPQPSADLKALIADYYKTDYLPRLHTLVNPRGSFEEYMPLGRGAYALQAAYIVRNPFGTGTKQSFHQSNDLPGYSKAHGLFHPSFRKITDEFGYYDLFLVDTSNGRVVYTVEKEVDFATSLYIGPYRESGLARVVKEARDAQDPNAVGLADFEMYEPSFGAPAAFAAAAIREGDELLGVLAVQLPNNEIDNVVSGDRGWERDGLGKSGDSGIVGADYLLRSNARGFLQRREEALEQMRARGIPRHTIARIRAYGSTVLQQQVRLPSVESALKGEEGTRVQFGSAGRPTLVSYMPLRIPGLHWTFASRIDLAEALAPVERLKRRLMWTGTLMLLATAVVALLLTRTILAPVTLLVHAARKVASGDLSVQAPVTTNDELGLLSRTFNEMVTSIHDKTEIIEQKNRENEALLLNILPMPIAERLKGGETSIADNFAEVTVMFADLVGFTNLSAKTAPGEMVSLLNDLFTRFDHSAHRYGVEKIKTIGDAYMAVAGLPTPHPDHARRIAGLALEILDHMRDFRDETGWNLSIRMGINSGPVVAGVIGSSKFIYDLWGDTVNVASRMESHGLPGTIQVTRSVYEHLSSEYDFKERGAIEVKGKGMLETWLLRPSVFAAGRSV